MDDKELCERRLGTTLRGKWTLERLLGIGGMAAVYVGVHKIGRRDAIKILHPDAARSDDMRARFEQEAYAVNRLGHPGVVEIRDIETTEDGAPFLVMELLEGEPLSKRAQRLGGIEPAELLRLIDELLDVLVVAHAQGIVHRDIKLDNLFVLTDGRLKVLDFGIAHMRSDLVMRRPTTRIGTKLGTAPYMPPEQVKGLSIDGRADLFAVGATMFRVVAKRRIHEARTEPEMLLLMATTPAPPLAEVAPHAPSGVSMIVDRALAFNRRNRYPDAITMQGDVRAVRRGKPPPYASAKLMEGDLPNSPESIAAASDPAPSIDFSDKPTVMPGRRDEPTVHEAVTRINPPPGPSTPNGYVDSVDPLATTAPNKAPGRAAPTLAMETPGAGEVAPVSAGFGPPPSMNTPASVGPSGTEPSGPVPAALELAVPAGFTPTAPTLPPLTQPNPASERPRATSRALSVMTVVALLVLVIAGAGLGWTLRETAGEPESTGGAGRAAAPATSPAPAPTTSAPSTGPASSGTLESGRK